MCAASNDLLKKLELLHRTLDQRKRPEDVATMILESGEPLGPSEKIVREAAKQSTAYSSMSDDFHRSFATLDRQLMLASMLFATDSTVDPEDAKAVSTYLASVEATIGKALGASDYKRDRLNREQRAAIGLGELSRRQYNKRFRLAARMEDKLRRRAREQMKRALTLASKSRLASRLPLSQFVSDPESAFFIAYYVARCNLRSLFTVNAQVRPYDQVCDELMKQLRTSFTTNWFAIAHVMPDTEVVRELTQEQRGQLLGAYYEMLIEAGRFLQEVWASGTIQTATMIVRRGNDSSTWNLMAGAWNKLRDGWFTICRSLGAEEIIERQCFGKVLRLMAADVAAWHRSMGKTLHGDTDVWAALPRPWRVLAGEEVCTREQVEWACTRFGVNPLKSGWLDRTGTKRIERFAPTPELVHGVVVSSPEMAKAMRKAGIFSGQRVKLGTTDADIDDLIEATLATRKRHWEAECASSD